MEKTKFAPLHGKKHHEEKGIQIAIQTKKKKKHLF